MILWNNENDLFEFVKPPSKRGCVFPIVIWAAFRMGQYRVNDHPYHAPQFIGFEIIGPNISPNIEPKIGPKNDPIIVSKKFY